MTGQAAHVANPLGPVERVVRRSFQDLVAGLFQAIAKFIPCASVLDASNGFFVAHMGSLLGDAVASLGGFALR